VVIRVARVLAPNPSAYTLEGTNTWVVRGHDGKETPTVVIDPGPLDEGHVRATLGEVGAGGIGAILLTHHHPDHAPAAAMLSELSGAPVLALVPDEGERALGGGEEVGVEGVRLRVVPSPGHSADHAVFHDPKTRALFTGDAILGRGTSVIDPPDGDMAAYVISLGQMLDLRPSIIYPGHGPVVDRAEDKVREYLDHRGLRERQVLEALGRAPRSSAEVVPEIYGATPEHLHVAAARSVLAHLLKLESEGRVVRVGGEDEGAYSVHVRWRLMADAGLGSST
jgi:glyoxylase-like metal-dependent hydrolase (beta-lactamase superfamily II)